MHSRDKEIRRFLCGYVEQQQGYLLTVEGFKKNILREPLQGSFNVRYQGAYYLMREYRINGKTDSILEWVEKRIFSLGSPAILRKRIDDACALRVPRFTNPVFFDMERQEKRLLLRIYTAPGLLARWTCKKALKLFEADMPEKLMPCDVELSRKEQRAAAKQQRLEEKALRHKRNDEVEEAEETPKEKPVSQKKAKAAKIVHVPEYKEELAEPEEIEEDEAFAEPETVEESAEETAEAEEAAPAEEVAEKPAAVKKAENPKPPAAPKPERKPAAQSKKPAGNSRPNPKGNQSSRPKTGSKSGNKGNRK